MVIQNNFPRVDHNKLSQIIFEMIHSERRLTPRSYKHIKELIKNNCVYVAYENKQYYGCIIKEHLVDNIYELKSWYINPRKRKEGVGRELLESALGDTSHTYLASTFYTDIITYLKKRDFSIIRLSDLPFRIVFLYIVSRNWKSIIKHLFTQKSYLLIKRP